MLLSADAVYLPEFQYEALKKFLFFSVIRKIIQKIFGGYETLSYICRIIIKRKNKMANFKTAMTALKNGYKVEYEGNIMKMQGGRVFDQTGFMCTDYLNLFCKKRTGFKILGK